MTNFTSQQLEELFFDENLINENDEVTHEVVESDSWEDEGKFASKAVVFKELATDKHFVFHVYRSGSYFSHYDYEFDTDVTEVKKVTETITIEKWVNV